MLASCSSHFLVDRLGRCLKLFVSTDSTTCHEFASQFGLDICVREKHPNRSRIPRRIRYCLFESNRYRPCDTGENGALPSSWFSAQTHRTAKTTMATVVGWCARARECVCMRACVRVCVCACVRDVFAIYDNNIFFPG